MKKDEDKLKMFRENMKKQFLEWNRKRKKLFQKYHINKIILLAVMSLALIMTVSLYINAKMTNVSNLKSNLEQKTIVYDINEEFAGSLYSQKGTAVSLDHISDNIELAVLSTEDQDFYQHPGFSIKGIGRAAVGYVLNRGNIVGGGSTLTQQLAKNAYLSADQTLVRKMKELFLSIEIEKQYSKDEILEMYLNNVYFGNGVWGVEDASMKYFGKSSSELDVSESAAIAGMLTAPSANNPIDNYDNSITRKNTVLMLMAEEGYISPEIMASSQAAGLQLIDRYQDTDDYRYPYYFDAVIEEAIREHGIKEEDLLNNGYHVYTSLNQNHQQAMNNAYSYEGYFPSALDGTPVESASVALDPETGGITALIGGRGEHSFRGYNRATQMRRQPGSTMKPFGVYVPALEKGYDTDDMLVDQELSYGKEKYTPYNVDRQFSPTGEVPMYQAVAESKNAPAVWLLNELGLNQGVSTAKDFGLQVSNEDENLAAVALGGMTKGVTPVELAAAYGALANQGVRAEPYFITKIVDSTGKTIVDNTRVSSKRVTSKSVSKDMTAMLLEVFGPNGTAVNFQPAGYTVAGKTGTTDARFESGATDKWLVGYTPDIVVAGWVGFDEPTTERSLTFNHNIGEIVQLQLEGILPYTEGSSFDTEGSIVTAETEQEESRLADILEQAGPVIEKVWQSIVEATKLAVEKTYEFFYNLFSQI